MDIDCHGRDRPSDLGGDCPCARPTGGSYACGMIRCRRVLPAALFLVAVAGSPMLAQAEPTQDGHNKPRMRSPALAVVGFSVAIVGVVGLVAGAAVYANAEEGEVHCDTAPCDTSVGKDGAELVSGTVLMIGGGTLLAGGMTMGIIGALDADPEPSTVTLVVGPQSGLRISW